MLASTVIICLLLVGIIEGSPKYSYNTSKHQPRILPPFPGLSKPRIYNINNIPEEDQIADWNNPWTSSSTGKYFTWFELGNIPEESFAFPLKLVEYLPVHLSGSFTVNNDVFSSKMMKKRDYNNRDSQHKRNFMRFFRIFKKSMDEDNGDFEEHEDTKRNFVPMLGR